jgi:AraC-like DNA-binding protein
MKKPDFIQLGFIQPFIKDLSNAGCNLNRLIKASKFYLFDLSNPNAYMPKEFMYNFFKQICQEENISDLSTLFPNHLQASNLGDTGELVLSAPDLLSSLKTAEKHEDIIFTHERMRLTINGKVSKFSSRFVDNPVPGRDETDKINFVLLLNHLRSACGEEWVPQEVKLQSSTAPDFNKIFPENCNTHISLDQEETALIFPTKLLASKMPGNKTNTHIGHKRASMSLTTEITQILDKYDVESIPTIELLAEIFNMSTRSFLRKLHRENTTYKEILSNWRFIRSLNLLSNPQKSINQISSELQYSNPSNFVRAFYQWTNVSPARYRDHI